MPANLIVPLSAPNYTALVNNPDPAVAAAKTDPLFVFDAGNNRVEIHGEFRDLGTSANRRQFRDLLSPTLRDPELSITNFGTPAYQLLTRQRRDNARAGLAGVAPPIAGAAPPQPPPPPGASGDVDATTGAKTMLAAGGGMVLGYDHKDQSSKDFTTDLIKKAGGTQLKHLFVEELASDLQDDIDAFLDDPAAEMSAALRTRISELQGLYKADFEPMLYAARDKGVRLWGIDTTKADPQVTQEDPRYHERRLALMNAEAKRVFDEVQRKFPGEPFMALTGQMHVNTADGGIPGLAQIMGAPGFSFDAKANRLASNPEDTSKRASVSPLERECVEAILKKAAADYRAFVDNYRTLPAYTTLPDPKPNLDPKLNLIETTLAVQQLVAGFTGGGLLNVATDIPGLVGDPAVGRALTPIFRANVLRSDRRSKLATAIGDGDLAGVQGALNADPYLAKMPADDAKRDTLLHAACAAGKPAIVQELLTRGLAPNAIDLEGRTPLHRALGDREGGAPPPTTDVASVVGRLLAGGANPAFPNPKGESGLDLAKTGPLGKGEIVQKFVEAGAAPATDLFVKQFVEQAERLYAAAKVPGGAAFDADEAKQAATALTRTLPGGGVPLGNPGEVAAALTDRAVTAELSRLTTLLQNRAARMRDAADAIDKKDLVKLRAALDADPRLAQVPIDANNHMALGLAALKGDDAAVAELIGNRGVDVDQKNPIGRTALHELLSQEIPKTDRGKQRDATSKANNLILRHGADVNARNGRGQTALHLAGFSDNVSMVGALARLNGTDNAPDPDARDNRGWTPLDTTMASTNLEAETLLHEQGMGGTAAPLKDGKLSSIDILSQATRCEDDGDSHKARKFIEKLYANEELRPMLDLAAAAACNDRDPPDGGLRLFASKTNTVGGLFSVKRAVGPTAAYDEKVNTLLFPLADDPGSGKDGDAVGSLAHELTHLTAHLVTDDPDTLPFTDDTGKAEYLAAIDADVRKLPLLDDKDAVQKYIKDRFSGRMDSYRNQPGTSPPVPRSGAEFDKALMQEFIVGVPQFAAVYGMDELEKHMPGLVKYYREKWLPKVQNTLATDPRFATGRAKIDTAANDRAAAALADHPARQVKEVMPVLVKKNDDRLNIDTLMAKIEADFMAAKGRPKAGPPGSRTIAYQPDDYALTPQDQRDFQQKRPAIRSALATALGGDNFPPEINLDEIRALVETVTGAVTTRSGDQLKDSLNNRALNWVKDAKTAYVDRRIEDKRSVAPRDLAEVIAYRSEAKALAGGVDADLDPDANVKASKQRDLISKLASTLANPSNAIKLKDPVRLIETMSAALSAQANRAVYQKPGSDPRHVSTDVKRAKVVWLAQLKALH